MSSTPISTATPYSVPGFHNLYLALLITHVLDNIEDDSPYPEVRSAVANFDDPDMPASTLRAWTLGVCWAIIIPGMNQFFYLRFPSVVIGSVSIALPFTVSCLTLISW